MLHDPVPAEYRHRPKVAVPRAPLEVGGVRLKWYDLRPEAYAISDALEVESRARIRDDLEAKRLDVTTTMGFVILHIAGQVGMLIVSTWDNSNEIWESVYLKDLPNDTPYTVYDRRGHLPTYCVWELGIVWHERNAFERYLYSTRDAAALRAYFDDHLAGRV